MKTRRLFALFAALLLVLLLAACAGQSAAPPDTGSQGGTPVGTEEINQAILAAQSWLASQLGVAVEDVKVTQFAPAEWTDSCLGLGGPAESCLQAVTPGFQATLTVNGQEYEVRTDATGAAIRSPQLSPTPQAGE